MMMCSGESATCALIMRFGMCISSVDIFAGKIWKGSANIIVITSLAICRRKRLELWSMGAITLFSEPVLLTITIVCACEASVTASATTTLWYMLTVIVVEESKLSTWSATVAAFAVFEAGIFMSTGCQCQGTSLRSDGKIFKRTFRWMTFLTIDQPHSCAQLKTTCECVDRRDAGVAKSLLLSWLTVYSRSLALRSLKA